VYSSFELAKKFLRYYVNGSNSKGHGMHSPFVFDFILNVLNNKSHYEAPASIEELRRQYLSDQSIIKTVEMGAGSRSGNAGEKKLSAIASTALKNKKYAQLMFRLARHYQPQTIIELGTSLGITAAYLASAHPRAELITIEGNPYIREKAMDGFSRLGLTNVNSLQGNFDEVLPVVLQQLKTVDLAYIDGNHKKEPTLNYFDQMLEKTNDLTIMVFDDIHWSREMEEAWEEIRQHPSVQYTIDIFYLGFVFFRKEFKVKQNFSIRF
jgi:predicted O-methyltransferase YrrM